MTKKFVTYDTVAGLLAGDVEARVGAAIDNEITAERTTERAAQAATFAPIGEPLAVKLTGAQTIAGLKDFTTAPTINGSPIGTGGAATTDASLLTTGTLADARLPATSNAAAVGAKAPTASPTFTGTVAGVTKTHVGLGSVDNTTDAAKPVSTAQAAADTAAKARANHTGTQLAATVSDFAAAVALLSPVAETFSLGGTLTVVAGTSRWYNPTARTLTFVSAWASVSTAPTGASIIVDITKGGTTIFTTQATRPTIAAAGFTNTAGAAQVTTLAAGEYLTIDVDQVGSTIAGANLTVQVVYA